MTHSTWPSIRIAAGLIVDGKASVGWAKARSAEPTTTVSVRWNAAVGPLRLAHPTIHSAAAIAVRGVTIVTMASALSA
jgi:hypothetical protein